MKRDKFIVGSRGSKLAIIYTKKVMKFLKNVSSTDIEIKKIVTSGDENQKDRLSNIGGKGLFSKKIETELINHKIDIAVHALKDMPSIETEGLITNFYLKRNSPNEIFISNNNIKFQDLKPNSIIGTSSYRREFQLQSIRSDLNYKLIRGNVDTRINKLENGDYDAILLSKAGIEALGLTNKITQEFDTEELIPCAGQGIIAIQCREDDKEVINILEKINDNQSRVIANAERNVLKILEGDCDTAVGVYAKINKDIVNIKAELFSVDGKQRFYVDESENEKMINDLSIKIGEKLKSESKGSYKR
ncbi:hydroxymethylbilane synthase [Candidatus Pelagibacter sp.]|jgi:hydroxymethylbilane synthase|nr:hydroxymethylbilane synthase [Candidatus Pelagibacter sp.]